MNFLQALTLTLYDIILVTAISFLIFDFFWGMTTYQPNTQSSDTAIVAVSSTPTQSNSSKILASADPFLELISHLNKRQIRTLCAPLNVRQKLSGVEKTRDAMVGEVLSIFESDRDRVIAVVRERLPNLIPTAA
ncbi:MAG: hypothetical protein SWY16_24865 [Cyanobacteriota bacterium]|nr:hypothetical protein [Cyanobacteriota bacterium]